LDPNLAEAANDLGATPVQALWLVVFPQIKVAIFAAAAIAFTMSFDDFVISYFTAGSATNISIYLYTLRRGVEPTINALSTIIIAIIGVVVTYRYLKSNQNNEQEIE
jgi:spermidine/putrescine transport system permease protein